MEKPPSIDGIIEALNAGETKRGNKAEMFYTPSGERFTLDQGNGQVTFQFADGYTLYGEYHDGVVTNATLEGPDGEQLSQRDDGAVIAQRTEYIRQQLTNA